MRRQFKESITGAVRSKCGLIALFTPGFSQVALRRSADWKPSKRFSRPFRSFATRLKPGVNEND